MARKCKINIIKPAQLDQEYAGFIKRYEKLDIPNYYPSILMVKSYRIQETKHIQVVK